MADEGPFIGYLNMAWKAREDRDRSVENQRYENANIVILERLKQVAVSADIYDLLRHERSMIEHGLKYDANSSEEKNSLKAAREQLSAAKECLDSLYQNPKGYADSAAVTYPPKKREAGLPLDGFREFLKSQNARLANRLAGQASHSEKLILRQRKINLSIMKNSYVELQRKSLNQ